MKFFLSFRFRSQKAFRKEGLCDVKKLSNLSVVPGVLSVVREDADSLFPEESAFKGIVVDFVESG